MNSDQRFSTLFSVVMILATAMLGWVSLKDGASPRVADNRSSAPVPADEQDVVARLWEDPLQAVQPEATKKTDAAAPPSHKHSVASLAVAITNAIGSGSTRVGLMVVSIPDTPFPDDIETRLRLRYSVQVALADNGYAPESRNYLGYFRLPTGTATTDAAQTGPVVPYEWFVPKRSHQDTGEPTPDTAMLVLWLPEGQLARAPLQLLANLREQLICSLDADKFCGIFVIGPQSSDTLKSLVRDARARSEGPGLPALQDKLAIFSPQATAADALIDLEPRARWSSARENLAELLHRAIAGPPTAAASPGTWRYFHNFIATDDQLTGLLAAELALRGISCTKDRILILSEADTAYGRSLPLAFQASLEADPKPRLVGADRLGPLETNTPGIIARQRKQAGEGKANSQLLIYRYLRGLDQQKGQPQNTDKSPRPSAKTPEEVLTAALSRRGAMALGESQLDYVDRLVEQIQQSAQSRSEVKAVGVLGADIYDKLILLRSLRPQFPDAVFFTTDLDARMWHPDHLPFTRNLVVASASDVRATTADQNAARIPPFRDVYQATVFRACGAALQMAENGARKEVPPPDPPALFELGRDGPRQLEVFASPSKAKYPELSFPQKCGSLAVMFGLVGAVVLWRKSYRNQRRPYTAFTFWVALSALLLGTFSYTARYYYSAGTGTEPWTLGEGLSIWPTEILRLFIACTVIATLLWAWRKQGEFHENLKQHHFITGKPDPAAARTTPLCAEHLIADYEKDSRAGRRALRVLGATLAYMALGFGLVFLVDGAMPTRTHIRGDFARNLDKVFLIVSITCFLALVFYVLDSVLITARLLARVSEPTAWPKALLAETRRLYRVPDKDMDGYLDVQFAAEKSEETGRLIYMPFMIQFLFILSRNSYFDNWTWPGTLVFIFVGNFLLACTAWGILRRSARNIQHCAQKYLREAIHQSAMLGDVDKNRHEDLQKMQKRIEEENRGAYARFIQDPALLAMLLPSGVFGILSILFRVLFNGM